MEKIFITENRIKQILPKNIIETDVLSEDAKKVLATIINYLFVQNKAKENGFLCISNILLTTSSTLGKNIKRMLNAVQELKDCVLIERKEGQKRQAGEKSKASEYYVNWDALKLPIHKKNFDELLEDFFRCNKFQKKPISTTSATAISTPNSASVSTYVSNNINNSIYNPTSTNMSTDVSTTTNHTVLNNTVLNNKSIPSNKVNNKQYTNNSYDTVSGSDDGKIVLELNQFSTVEDCEIAEMKVREFPNKYKIVRTKVVDVDFGFNVGMDGMDEKKTIEGGSTGDKRLDKFNEDYAKSEERENTYEGYKQLFQYNVERTLNGEL